MHGIYGQRAIDFLDRHISITERVLYSFDDAGLSERRRNPRLKNSLPARVWGIDNDDEMIGVDSQVENISATGLFLRVSRQFKVSSQISLVVRLKSGSGVMAAITGKVLRDQPLLDGSRGLAVKITKHRFL